MKPIDLYSTYEEITHRDTELTWMNWFNSESAQHQHSQYNKTFEFFEGGSDTHALWQRNHERLPSWWRWHTETFNYSHNKEGFRNSFDFNSVDWSRAHVLFGCSQVTCHGVPVKESIAHYMQQIVDAPVVCIGLDSGSCDVVFNNVVKMINDHGVPAGVHVIWPESLRQIDDIQLILDDHGPTWLRRDIGPWDGELKHMQDATPYYRRNLYQHTVRQLCRGALYSELSSTSFDVVHGEVGHSVHPHKLKMLISTPFPDHVVSDINKKWRDWSESTREWYFNNFLARDVYSPAYVNFTQDRDCKGNPQHWSHAGGFVNKTLAEYFIKAQTVL